jgi:hypothetical protein
VEAAAIGRAVHVLIIKRIAEEVAFADDAAVRLDMPGREPQRVVVLPALTVVMAAVAA